MNSIYDKSKWWTSKELAETLMASGLQKMGKNESSVQLVVPQFIFDLLIGDDILKDTIDKRGYKDLIGDSFFKPCGDGRGKIFTKYVVRVWNEDSLIANMQKGRRICL